MAHPMNPRAALRLALVLCIAALVAGCGKKSESELVASGQQLARQKDLAGAIIQYKNALQQNPESKDARLALGQALLEQGDPVAALVELRKAQQLQAPDDDVIPVLARAMLLAGEEAKLLAAFGAVTLQRPPAAADLQSSLAAAHLLNGDLERARRAIATALEQVPRHGPALTLQARLKALENDPDGALALLDQAIDAGDPEGRAGQLRADILWHGKNDLDGALKAYAQVLAAHPRAVGAHTATIAILTKQGKADQAKAQIQTLRQLLPQHPESLFYAAQQSFADKDYKATRELTDRLLKGMPDNPRVLELAGATEYRDKQYARAEALFGKALKAAPGQLPSRHMLAQTHLRTGQPAKAIEVLQPVLESPAADGTSLTLAGEAWAQLGEAAKADQAFAAAAKLAPNDTRVRTSAAMAQLARGNAGAAVAQLESIAAEDTGTRADIALVMARLRQNDLDGALKAIDGLERKTPDRALAANLRGRVLLLQRDTPAAIRAFEAALAKEAHYFPAVASLAAIDLSAGKPQAARKRFEDLAQAKPRSAEPWLALAELSSRLGDAPDQIAQHLRSAVKANTGSAAAHLALINHLVEARDGKAALTAAQEARAAVAGDLRVLEALGRAQLTAGTPEQAAATFRELTVAQPANPVPQLRLAEALLAHKDSDGSRRALRRALDIQPDFMPARRALVELAMRDNKPDEALALVREIRSRSPKDPAGAALEGDLELARGRHEAAVVAYRGALQLGRSADVAMRLNLALRRAGRLAESDRFAAEWLKENPRDTAFRFHLGDLALAQNPALAESHYRAVLELQPRNALALNNLSFLMLKQGKPGAVAMAEKANELLPGRPQLMDTLAQALAAEGKLPRAIDLQKAALARAPGDPNLRLTLAKMLIQNGDKAYARAELEDLTRLGERFRDQAEVAALLKTL